MTLTALAMVVAILTSSALGLAQRIAVPCATQQHDCAPVATIAECCCDGSSSPSSTPAEPRVKVNAASTFAAAPVVLQAVSAPLQVSAFGPIDVSPRTCLFDLPILFSTLLI
jgi:hypothetical protein